jgi:hypothetical protein
MQNLKTTRQTRLTHLYIAVGLAALPIAGLAVKAQTAFQPPKPEELSMASVPGYPGASAVVLFREDVTSDDMHSMLRYERVKILTEEGKKYANVELHFGSTSDYNEMNPDESVSEIEGRTIHPDGKIISFAGKPYVKTIVKTKDFKYQAKVFTLPDVEVGSIIEYRYAFRFADHIFEEPEWYIQGDLFIKQAHYVWHPTTHDLQDSEGRAIHSIAWFPILPQGVAIAHSERPGSSTISGQQTYEVTVKDVPPAVEEAYMPPLKSYGYRVLFSFTPFSSQEEYWKSSGKQWSKRNDSFMKQNSEIAAATQTVIAGATSPDEKLHKIYAKVMTLENTDYTRERSKVEQGKTNTISDVFTQGRGSSSQLTDLFIGMARAAGFKSYLMAVPDQNQNFFVPSWLNMRQLSDRVAIVVVDGKEQFFDPGTRYCPYGHLAWQHEFAEGIRQSDTGTVFTHTSGDGYAANMTGRVANLQMDEHGEIAGKIDLTFNGATALHWRSIALSSDEQVLHDRLEKELEDQIPHSLEVKVAAIQNSADYEKPFKVSYEVHGSVGTPTGKRLVVPVDLFESNAGAVFTQDKRETAVDFHYPQIVQDALRISFPKGFEVEAMPKPDKVALDKRGIFTVSAASTPTSITTRRTIALGETLYLPKDYSALRDFYSKLQAIDKEKYVLKIASVVAENKGGN